jgi:hypothetical protein
VFVNCREQRVRLMELARAGVPPRPELEAHLAACEECRNFRDEQLALGSLLAQMAQENAAAALPGGVEARVFAELGAALAPRKLWRPWAAAALAASLAAGIFMAHGPAPKPPARAAAGPFVEIPFVAPLAPYERAHVKQMDVPVASLIAAGFEVHLPDMAGTVKADVLLGQDGRAHAIRLVPEVNQ